MKTSRVAMLPALTFLVLLMANARTGQAKQSSAHFQFARPLSLSLSDAFNLSSKGNSPCHNSTRHVSSAALASHKGNANAPSITAPATTNEFAHVRRRQQETTRKKEPREKVVKLKAFYYFIQALGNSESNGCKQPQPSFTATCPQGAFIVSQSSKSEWTSRLDCHQEDPLSVQCIPKELSVNAETKIDDIDMEDQNGVVVACYASSETEYDEEENRIHDLLQVSVEVHAGSYFCDKALEVRTMPHPAVIAGGTVYQTVAIQKQCWADNGDEESWIFVEPACGSSRPAATTINREHAVDGEYPLVNSMLQHTEVPIQMGDAALSSSEGGGVGRLPTSNVPTAVIAHCQMQNNCTAELECSPRCAGFSFCNVDLPGFLTASTPVTTSVNPPEPCLPRDFAMNLRDGADCEFNLMCNSGVCIHGVCESVQWEDHEACEENSDCLSQACGKHPVTATSSIDNADIPDKTCCPSGKTFGHEGESFCSEAQPIGAACHEDSMCGSNICIFNTCRPELLDDGIECEEPDDCLGGHCGHYHDEDAMICCATGDSILLSEGIMCSNRPTGDECEYTVNSLCKSNICVEGVCQGIEQEVGETCDNHFDCANDACALATADPSAPYICCPTGEYVFLSTSDVLLGSEQASRAMDAFPINGLRVCTGQPLGASCGETDDVDDMCTSGLCIEGTCHEASRAGGAPCDKDSDCENNVCALSSLDDDAPTVCCPSNDHKHVYTDELKDVCTEQPLGANCGEHSNHGLCESGYCNDSTCQEGEP